jgi:hypothetical protein
VHFHDDHRQTALRADPSHSQQTKPVNHFAPQSVDGIIGSHQTSNQQSNTNESFDVSYEIRNNNENELTEQAMHLKNFRSDDEDETEHDRHLLANDIEEDIIRNNLDVTDNKNNFNDNINDNDSDNDDDSQFE